ncbi:MAG: hypothetical protein II736_03160 [Clostridia bacterium]|nr:hypothetical protein [Clostridia bacterium]
MKKSIAIILAVFTVISLLVSCTKSGGRSGSKEKTDTDDEYTTYVKELAQDVNFDGMTFTLIGRSGGNFPIKDEETGDIGSDAVYHRQRDLEDIFGISWEPVITEIGPDTADQVINEVMAGGDSYDLSNGSTQTVGQPLLNAGVIMNVSNLEHVDMSREWWIEAMQTDYAIKGQTFFLTGPIVVNNYCDTTCMLFNKTVTELYGIDDAELYQTVRDGDWTLDKMFEVASAVPENPSGNGVWRYDEPPGFDFIFTSGYRITKFNDEGEPYVEDKLPVEFSNLSDKLCPVFSDDGQTIHTKYKKNETPENKYGVEDLRTLFIDNRALFRFGTTEGALEMRKEDVTFGILPYPKRDSTQKEYCSYARMGQDSAVYVPRTVKSLELTDVITEAMGALSQKYIKEAYYEKLLKGQSIFDAESSEMLDLIFSTKVYDLIALYSGADFNQWGDFLETLEYSIKFDNSNLASGYAGSARLTNVMAKQLVAAVDKIDS